MFPMVYTHLALEISKEIVSLRLVFSDPRLSFRSFRFFDKSKFSPPMLLPLYIILVHGG